MRGKLLMTIIKPKLNELDVPVWLSIATVVGYGLYYIKAVTFNMYYRLPVNFIELKIENLASVIVFVVLAMSILLSLPELSKFTIENSTYLNSRKQTIKKLLGILLAILMLTISTLYLFNVIGQLPVILILIFIGILLRFDNMPPFLVILFFIIVGGFLSIKAGEYSSAEKENYLIMEVKNGEDYAVIKTYKDMFIVAPVDLKKGIITPKFQFIDMKSEKDNEFELVLMETGQLKVKSIRVNE
jgi:hypothetical protein